MPNPMENKPERELETNWGGVEFDVFEKKSGKIAK